MYEMYKLMPLANEITLHIQNLKEFYPELTEYNAIKRLISLADKWVKIQSELNNKDGV